MRAGSSREPPVEQRELGVGRERSAPATAISFVGSHSVSGERLHRWNVWEEEKEGKSSPLSKDFQPSPRHSSLSRRCSAHGRCAPCRPRSRSAPGGHGCPFPTPAAPKFYPQPRCRPRRLRPPAVFNASYRSHARTQTDRPNFTRGIAALTMREQSTPACPLRGESSPGSARPRRGASAREVGEGRRRQAAPPPPPGPALPGGSPRPAPSLPRAGGAARPPSRRRSPRGPLSAPRPPAPGAPPGPRSRHFRPGGRMRPRAAAGPAGPGPRAVPGGGRDGGRVPAPRGESCQKRRKRGGGSGAAPQPPARLPPPPPRARLGAGPWSIRTWANPPVPTSWPPRSSLHLWLVDIQLLPDQLLISIPPPPLARPCASLCHRLRHWLPGRMFKNITPPPIGAPVATSRIALYFNNECTNTFFHSQIFFFFSVVCPPFLQLHFHWFFVSTEGVPVVNR